MHLMYFTEQPMAAYDAKEGLKYGATALTFSNSNYDPVEGSRLYNEYLEEYIMADEWGVDGIMLNEHHNAPFCMQSRTNMFGAIRWEGTHYQHRVVNPWALPVQKPYPRVWIPGVLSRETVIWTAQQRYPYIALNTAIDATKTIWDTYSKAAKEVGYEAGPENFGYLIRVHVLDDEEKAMQNARQFMWMQGEFTGL